MSRQVAWIHPDEVKAGRAIDVPLNVAALDVLRRRLGRHGDYVFAYQGKPMFRCSTKTWKRALERAGTQKAFRWHDLRHPWASWQELMALGSWASYGMVPRHAHLVADHLRSGATRIDGTFSTHKQKPQLVRLS
ncbi:MAG: hypothetical protein EPN74_03495 [Rhodanobacter sp.]|nr:MAG: hypothetical protein EPN74_03495 [Rhodanobacter sp.]